MRADGNLPSLQCHSGRLEGKCVSIRAIWMVIVCCVALISVVSFGFGTHRCLQFSTTVSAQLAGASLGRSKRHQRLLIAVPFTDTDVPALHDNVYRRWQEIGSACTHARRINVQTRTPSGGSNDDDRPVLWFYYAKNKNDLPREFTSVLHALTLRRNRHLTRCLEEVRVVHANLPPNVQNDYPAGINLMFYNLVLGRVLRSENALAAFHSVFWMEPDVLPIKPLWIDALLRESASDDQFWVKGSIYMGQMFDTAPEGGQDWQWIGHINGNALYRLNSPEFAEFLRIVMDVERPDDPSKPFDVSIWKALHDFPYFWHIYQRVAKRFVYADFIDHWAFTLTESDVQLSKSDPRTFLVHGKNTSAGTKRTRDKVKQAAAAGRRVGLQNNKEGLALEGSRKAAISVFIRSQAIEVDYAAMAVASVAQHLPEKALLEVVVAVPKTDVRHFVARLHEETRLNSRRGKKLLPRVVGEEPLTVDDGSALNSNKQETYTRSMADTYCRGSYILQMQTDSVMMRSVRRKDLFFAGKPIVRYNRYANLPAAAALWQAGTQAALGHRASVYVAASASTTVLRRDVYTRMRKWIEHVHARPFRSFLANQRVLITCLEGVDRERCQRPDLSVRYERGFALETVLGAFMWAHMHNSASWIPHDRSESRRTTYVPILTEFGCHGNSWLARKIQRSAEDLDALDHAITWGNCKEAASLRRPWMDKLVRRVG